MDYLEEIKNKIDLISFIAEYVPLKKSGRNFKALCPFHAEKTPSFIVSPERQIWHCFGCGEGGNLFDFLMKIENIEFKEALRFLAKKAGVVLPSYSPQKETQIKEKIYQINHLSAEFYHYLLTSHPFGKNCLAYLKKRGIKNDTISQFKLGYAPPHWQSVSTYLKEKKGFSYQDLETAGICIKGKNFYDRFRNRLIFPLIDHRDNVVGFSGRLLDPQIKEGKYINTPDTPVYSKSHHLFGINLTREYIKKEDQAILVEGEFDLLSSYQEGIKNLVAIKGSALTEGHLKILKRYTQNLVFALDADFAGSQAALKGVELADKEGFNMKVAEILAGKDPDECIRQNPQLWKKSLKESLPLYDYLLNFALKNHNPRDPLGKKNIAAFFLPFLKNISNEIVKFHYQKKLSQLLEVSEESISKELAKIKIPTPHSDRPLTSPPVLISSDSQEKTEALLLSLLLQNLQPSKMLEKINSFLFPSDFQNPIFKKIYAFLYSQKTPLTSQIFFQNLPAELLPAANKLYLFENKFENSSSEKQEAEIVKTAKIIKSRSLKKQIKDLLSLMQKAQKENEDEEKLSHFNYKLNLLYQDLKNLGL